MLWLTARRCAGRSRTSATTGCRAVLVDMPLPNWNHDGVRPANDVDNPTSHERSPYVVSLVDLVTRFGNTEGRRRIMIPFRRELHEAGLVDGFQWIDGSFVETVEAFQNRPPQDVDIVTFAHFPDGYSERRLLDEYPRRFDGDNIREQFNVDSYFVFLDPASLRSVVDQSIYWYSVWSHTRTGDWKGYLQVKLDVDGDATAKDEVERVASSDAGE